MSLRQHRSQKGFTLLELLLVVAIIMIVAGMAIYGARQSERMHRAENNARMIVSDLQNVKLRAAAEMTNTGLRFNIPGGAYQVMILDGGGNLIADPNEQQRTLQNLVVFDFGGAAGPPPDIGGALAQDTFIGFNSRGLPLDPNGYAVYVQDVDNDTLTYAVSVNGTGNVSIWQVDGNGQWNRM